MIPPFFSIIVPSFNTSETIRGLLNSILEQSFKHFEIVIIDGVSSDQTIEIIHSYNDPRIRVFSEKDNGIYDAMNKGIACAEGTWLYFMGADDIIYDSTILAQIKENIDNKSIKDIIYGDVQIIGNGIWAKHSDIYDGPFDMEKLFKWKSYLRRTSAIKAFSTTNLCLQRLAFIIWNIKLLQTMNLT